MGKVHDISFFRDSPVSSFSWFGADSSLSHFHSSSSPSSRRSLLITTVVPMDYPDETERILSFIERWSDPVRNVKVLVMTHREFFDIDDFILFSKNGIKFYNRIVDYKPYTVSSFVYGATIEAVSGKESLRERFWRPFLFSFVFAREYAFRDVLYVPFGECPIEWDRRFLDVECSAVSIYFPFSKDMLEALPCGVGAVSPLSLRIYIPHQFMFAFFDAAFVEPAFFDREWVDVLCDIVLP